MSTTGKVITFGTVSGIIWSLIPGSLVGLFQSSKESIGVVFAGLLTGIIVSLAFKTPLMKLGKGWSLFFGILALPFGAYVFGCVFSDIYQSGWFLDSQYGLSNAFQVGIDYVIVSVISLFAVILFPLAILTTLILRCVIHSGEKQAG